MKGLRVFFNDFFKGIEQKYEWTETRGFFSTVRVVSLTTCMLSTYLLKRFLKNFQGSHFLRKFVSE